MIKRIKDFINRNIIFKISFITSFVAALCGVVLYNILPVLLNYPPNFMEVTTKEGLSFTSKIVLISLIIVIVNTILYYIMYKGINKWQKLVCVKSEESLNELRQIREKCVNLPYLIYILQIVIPVSLAIFIYPTIATQGTLSILFVIRVMIVAFSFLSVCSIVSLLFSKRILLKVLTQTDHVHRLKGYRISMKIKLFIQIMPMFIAAVLFTSLIGYSRLVSEKGDTLYKLYKSQLTEVFEELKSVESVEKINTALNDIKLNDAKDCKFIILPDNTVITSDNLELGRIFKLYITNYYLNTEGRAYDATEEIQGAYIRLKGVDGTYIAGVKFQVVSNETVLFFIINFITLIVLNLCILLYLSKSLSDDISMVADGLTKITEGGNIDFSKKIPVTSNDEIGDLVIAFNKIQEVEKEHVEEIERNNEVLMQQERLASLGYMIGGIAHNLNTPIMSIAGAVEYLNDLVEEYKDSIDDDSVTREDHHEIAKDMYEWVNKIKPLLSYMSNMISTVKGQTVKLNDSSNDHFTLSELINRMEILMSHELKSKSCILNKSVEPDLNTVIKGEINNLIQILGNLILNAIDSYEGNGGEIDFKVYKKSSGIQFVIRDYGKGISENVRDKLFKQMVTTKGKNGTGLGLYMSYSAVKGRFGGNIWFECPEGKGTAFYIFIPA